MVTLGEERLELHSMCSEPVALEFAAAFVGKGRKSTHHQHHRHHRLGKHGQSRRRPGLPRGYCLKTLAKTTSARPCSSVAALRIERRSAGRIDRPVVRPVTASRSVWCASVFEQLSAASQGALTGCRRPKESPLRLSRPEAVSRGPSQPVTWVCRSWIGSTGRRTTALPGRPPTLVRQLERSANGRRVFLRSGATRRLRRRPGRPRLASSRFAAHAPVARHSRRRCRSCCGLTHGPPAPGTTRRTRPHRHGGSFHTDIVSAYSTWCNPSTLDTPYVRAPAQQYPLNEAQLLAIHGQVDPEEHQFFGAASTCLDHASGARAVWKSEAEIRALRECLRPAIHHFHRGQTRVQHRTRAATLAVGLPSPTPPPASKRAGTRLATLVAPTLTTGKRAAACHPRPREALRLRIGMLQHDLSRLASREE